MNGRTRDPTERGVIEPRATSAGVRRGGVSGGLWVGSYVKIATHQWLDERGVRAVAPPAARQSASEGLEGHRRAAQLRLNRL